jgi:Mg-chelatase subunit ChlD
MKKYLSLSLFLCCYACLYSFDKSAFDLELNRLAKTTNPFSTTTSYQSRSIANDIAEMTMISGGFFTIGTTGGYASTIWDDNCQITFGHPYAMTSYPLLAVDGTWQRLDGYFADALELSPLVKDNSLVVAATIKDLLQYSFSLTFPEAGNEIEVRMAVQNVSPAAHTFGLGLVIDPALGMWGDGFARLTDFITEKTLLEMNQVPDQLPIYEKSAGAKGMGIRLDFGSAKPDKIILTNWPDIVDNHSPYLSASAVQAIYDLAVKMAWDETALSPGEEKSAELTITILPPEFSATFLRWDLPTALSTQTSQVFPKKWDTFVQVYSENASAVSQAELSFESPSELLINPQTRTITALNSNPGFLRFEANAKDVFEDVVTPVNVQIKKNNVVLDGLTRQVLIPAIPLSDTGLVVSIDSLVTSSFPRVDMKFHANVASSGHLLTGLSRENLFLYENDQRIRTFDFSKDTTAGGQAADIIFVLDVTGSMGDEINQVKNNIIEFADSLSYRGVDYRLGMVTFLDAIENVYPFTTDVQKFQGYASQQYAHGGGDGPENSLEALMHATEFPFREQAKRIVIWITDADYHEHDSVTPRTKSETIDALLSHDITVHAIGATSFKSAFYDPITTATGGQYYDIYGNFRDILLEISRMRVVGSYWISYESPRVGQGQNRITLELHYAGLGGFADVTYSPEGIAALGKRLSCYPNPFNPETKIFIRNPDGFAGDVSIYNILGQRVIDYTLRKNDPRPIIWTAHNDLGSPVGTGFYIVRLTLVDERGRQYHETEKILYLK